MFRRVENTMEPDPHFDADLKKLGFFINTIGQIRMIEAPDKWFLIRATNNDRVNEVRLEAMHECIRKEVNKRLSVLGLHHLYLPGFTLTKPSAPHVPILAPSPEILRTRKRIIVIVNDAIQDLGILTYRQPRGDLGVNGGSVVNFLKELIKRSAPADAAHKYDDIFRDGFDAVDEGDLPALVVLNIGQLFYSHKYKCAMSLSSWSAMPRKSSAHGMIRIHEKANRVEGHEHPTAHVKTVFDQVLNNCDLVSPQAEIYIIGIEGGSEPVLSLMDDNFERYGARVAGMALIHSLMDDSQIKNASLRDFLRQRTRQWTQSGLTSDPSHCVELPKDYDGFAEELSVKTGASKADIIASTVWNENVSPASVSPKLEKKVSSSNMAKQNGNDSLEITRDEDTAWIGSSSVICPTFAGGEGFYGDNTFTRPQVQQAILSFFEAVACHSKDYRNPPFDVVTNAPQPSLEDPMVLSASSLPTCENSELPAEMTAEQKDIVDAKEELEYMLQALSACPTNRPDLDMGRVKLEKAIEDKKASIKDLEKKGLATGGLSAGEALDQRENWKPQAEGTKVPFAGTMVDSALLKAAGLADTADEELDKLGL